MEAPSTPAPAELTEGMDVTCGVCGKPGRYSADGALKNRKTVIHGVESSSRSSSDKATTKTCFIFKTQHRERTVPLPHPLAASSPTPLPDIEFRRGSEGTKYPLSKPALLPEFADLAGEDAE